VTVLATGTQMAREPAYGDASYRRRSASYSTVTLEVTPREAELLIFTQHIKGQISLSLRNPEDLYFEKELPEVNFQHLEEKLPELNEYRQRVIRENKSF
jgi:Flp pilus assembly protein CpaB